MTDDVCRVIVRANELLQVGWNPVCPLRLGEDLEPFWCLDNDPRCRSWTMESALERACRDCKVGLDVFWACEDILNQQVPPWNVLMHGLYFIWENQEGRTQKDVLDVMNRGVLRAKALARAALGAA